MVSALYLRKYLTYPYEIVYSEAPGQHYDQDKLGELYRFLRSQKPFKMASAQYLKNIWRILTKFGTRKHQGNARTKVTKVILCKSTSTQYLKKY